MSISAPANSAIPGSQNRKPILSTQSPPPAVYSSTPANLERDIEPISALLPQVTWICTERLEDATARPSSSLSPPSSMPQLKPLPPHSPTVQHLFIHPTVTAFSQPNAISAAQTDTDSKIQRLNDLIYASSHTGTRLSHLALTPGSPPKPSLTSSKVA